MQIVIDIPEDDLNFIKDMFADGEIPDEKDLKETTYYAIANGIVLPKGHGDLKDIAEIERLWQKGDYDSLASALIFAPTVIEADKTESEDKE